MEEDLDSPGKEDGGVEGGDTPRSRKKEGGRKATPGVIYLSRIPPYMQPRKVRHIFSQFGEVGRIFLQPEGESSVVQSFLSC